MTDVQVGDKVRVSSEFTVEEVNGNAGVRNGLRWYHPENWNIEVIEKRGPQIGDTIEGIDAYEALPLGAVVRGYDETWMRTTNGFQDVHGNVERELFSQRELVYLP